MTRELAPIFPALAAGLLVGLWHFRCLWHEAQGLVKWQGWRAMLWQRGSRYLATLTLFILATHWGGGALLAALAGWLLARKFALRADTKFELGAGAASPQGPAEATRASPEPAKGSP